jgi:LacI family transcriptional regulator
VDRVIHNRGEVAEDSRQRIQKILEELNYKPNLLARSLASKRDYKIVTLLPESDHNKGYWDAPRRGVFKATKEVFDYNVTVVNLTFNQFDIESFKAGLRSVMEMQPDAVLITPIYKSETIEFAGYLNASSIPYVFIDSNIEGLGNLSYFGQHSYQSGYIAARLSEIGLSEKAVIAIAKPTGVMVSNQMISRETGFKAYFEREGLRNRYQIVSLSFDFENEKERESQLDLFFRAYPAVSAIVIFNSKACEIANYLESRKVSTVRLVGYDLISENVDYLRKGYISFLLAQRPEIQGYQGVMTLFNHLVLKNEVTKVQYVPIDILTKDNLDYYINF